MTREIKFQFIYKGMPFSSENPHFNWHKKTYTLNQLLNKPLSELSDIHDSCELVAKRQYTGLKDKNGVEIYEGDILYVAGVGRCEVQWDCCGYWAFGEERLDCQDIIEDIEDVIGNIYETPELLQGEE